MNIILDSGRKVTLVSLRQWATYYGSLAGLPNQHVNDYHVQDALEKAAESCPTDSAPYLINPEVTRRERVSEGKPVVEERLPAVTCIGSFDSGELARPGSEPFSTMVVVWYQQDFGPPVWETALTGIKAMDWEAHAKDWMW